MSSMVFGAINGIIKTAPKITINDVTPSQYKTIVYDCNNVETETLVASGANRIYVTYDEIPDNLKMLLSQLRMSVSFPTTELMQRNYKSGLYRYYQ